MPELSEGAVRIGMVILVCVGVVQPSWVEAQSADNVAVVVNESSAESRTIGDYYVSKRGIPASNIFRITTSVDEVINRDTFTQSIEWPLRALISSRRLQDRLLYIVLTKGVPLRITGQTDASGTGASVDSELTLLYRRMVGTYVPLVGYVENPYFLKDGDVQRARPFTHRDHDIVLVSRLDGCSVLDVLALIDRAGASSKEELPSRGARTPSVPAGDAAPALFTAGTLVASVPPYRATTFRESLVKATTPGRTPTGPSGIEVADLVRQGATAAAGEASQTSIRTPIKTSIVGPAYLAGASGVEAFYLAMPYLSASTVVVGDPLWAPFRQRTLSLSEIEADIDPDTAQPGLFAERRLAEMSAALGYVPRRALALTLRAGLYVNAGDLDGARMLLEQVTAMAPQFATAQFNLGSLYEMVGEYELAIDRYRRTLQASPPLARPEIGRMFDLANTMPVHVGALNNLAYLLAVHRHEPAAALPFARKALAQAPHDPSVLDTLAWIEYLLGDTTNAAMHIRMALASRIPSDVIALHAASILAAVNAPTAAENLKDGLPVRPDVDSSGDAAPMRAVPGGDRNAAPSSN